MSAAVLNQARLACCRALFQLRPRLPTSTTQRSQTGVAVAYPRPRGYASVEDDLDILGQEAGIVRIDSCLPGGFLIGEHRVNGPILVSGGLLTSWHVKDLASIDAQALKIVDILKPVPDLVIIGTGDRMERLPEGLRDLLWEKHLAVEVSSTVNAVTTFNILNQEGRKVVGAFFPLSE